MCEERLHLHTSEACVAGGRYRYPCAEGGNHEEELTILDAESVCLYARFLFIDFLRKLLPGGRKGK